MLRGFTKFKCPKCRETFVGPDMELGASAFTAPLPCPKCGCKECLPKDSWFQLSEIGQSMRKKWKE